MREAVLYLLFWNSNVKRTFHKTNIVYWMCLTPLLTHAWPAICNDSYLLFHYLWYRKYTITQVQMIIVIPPSVTSQKTQIYITQLQEKYCDLTIIYKILTIKTYLNFEWRWQKWRSKWQINLIHVLLEWTGTTIIGWLKNELAPYIFWIFVLLQVCWQHDKLKDK